MERHAGLDPEGSADSNVAATLPPPDIQPDQQVAEPIGRVDDSALSYVKEIQDGEMRTLLLMVHPSDNPAPSQHSKIRRADLAAPRYHEADERLVRRLAVVNFRGPEFDLFHEQTVKTGYAVFTSWIMSGKMHKQCALKGRGLPEFPPNTDMQDRRDLATDTAVVGFELFRRIALIEGRWTPEGGASLLTFYIGAGINVFPNVYRRWRNGHIVLEVLGNEGAPEHGDGGIESVVVDHILLEELERRLPPRLWQVFRLKAQGYTYPQIAAKMETTPKAIERLVQRSKAKVDEIRRDWGGRCD